MLPMNKIMADVKTFADKQQKAVDWECLDYGVREDAAAIFAHELSQKYKELVSVKLVKSLITTYLDSVNKDKDYKGICIHFRPIRNANNWCEVLERDPTGMCQLCCACLAIRNANNWCEVRSEDCDQLTWPQEESGEIVPDSFEDLLNEQKNESLN